MNDLLGGLGGIQAQEALTCRTPYQLSTRERLKMHLTDAEKALADIKRACEILDSNPELEELLNILARNNY